MKCRLNMVAFIAGVMILTAGTAQAINITINDGSTGSGSWYGSSANTTVGGEDNEVEPGMQTGQRWDLEGFYLDGNILSLVGGYNFKDGELGNGILFTSGDIFIDKDGGAYDYAIDLIFGSTGYSYTVYGINNTTELLNAYYPQNVASNPWAIGTGGTHTVVSTGTLIYTTGIDNNTASAMFGTLTGGSHNVVSGLNLSFLGTGVDFTAHFTMGCGNDNVLGKGTTAVPEPGTLLLLGAGLVGLAGFRRRKRNQF